MIEVCTLLLNYGANVNAVTKNGCTALFFAAQQNKVEAVRLLLERQADPNIPLLELGDTPLFTASQKGFDQVVDLLLKYGADPALSTSVSPTLSFFQKKTFFYDTETDLFDLLL